MWQGIADWESLYARYLDAGGSPMDFEDRRGQMLRIFTKDARKEALKHLREFRSVAELTEYVRVHVEAEKDWDNADRHARRQSPAAKVCEHDGTEDCQDEQPRGPTAEDMEALMALQGDASPEELLAVQRRSQRTGARPGGRPERHRIQCAKCGKLGRTAEECRGGRPPPGAAPREPREQKCANCGKPGHAARDCKERRSDGGTN